TRSAADYPDSRADDGECADLRGWRPEWHSAVGRCHEANRAKVEGSAHRAEYPYRWHCDWVCVRADVCSCAGCRLAACALYNRQDHDESSADLRAHRIKQCFAHGAAQITAYSGDWDYGGPAGCRGAAAQKLYEAALSRCRLRNRKHA